MAHLMIVDDDEDFASAAATVLRKAGHEVDIELRPELAIERMLAARPDLLVLDVMFPEDASAGFEIARAVRHDNEALKDVPILMLTAVNAQFPLGFGPRDIDETWMPVTDFLEKPVDFDTLVNKVAALLGESPPAGEG